MTVKEAAGARLAFPRRDEQWAESEFFPAQSESAIKVLIHLKSIPETVRGDARLFCISGRSVIGHRQF
jgi:hypothetical protein